MVTQHFFLFIVVSLLAIIARTRMHQSHKGTKHQSVQRLPVKTILQHIAEKESKQYFSCVSTFLIQFHG